MGKGTGSVALDVRVTFAVVGLAQFFVLCLLLSWNGLWLADAGNLDYENPVFDETGYQKRMVSMICSVRSGAQHGGFVHSGGFALERAQSAVQDGASPGVRPLQGCPGFGVSRRRPGANRFRRDLGVAPLIFGLRPCGRQVRESDRLHAKLECAGETDLPIKVLECVTGISKQGTLLEVRSVGRSARVERVQRTEAGFKRSSCRASSGVDSSCDSLSATRVESPSSRAQRVNVALHENSHLHNSHARMHENSLARSLHDLHDARFMLNLHNSVGDWAVRGRGVCVPGETKPMSTSTRLGVRCPAVEKLASLQQAPGRLPCRDVGRTQWEPQPADFPAGGNHAGVR